LPRNEANSSLLSSNALGCSGADLNNKAEHLLVVGGCASTAENIVADLRGMVVAFSQSNLN
jgi:hypothetical protein